MQIDKLKQFNPKGLPWAMWIPKEWKICEACEPQHNATKVQAKATRLRLLARSSSFFFTNSFHFLTFSATPKPDSLLFVGNPHSVNLRASPSATLVDSSSSFPSLTAAVSVNMLTTTESTRSSEEIMVLTRETQPPHIIPVTSSRTGESLICVWLWRSDSASGERISVLKVFDMEKFGRRILRRWWLRLRRRSVGSREVKWLSWLGLKRKLGGEERDRRSRWDAIIGGCNCKREPLKFSCFWYSA